MAIPAQCPSCSRFLSRSFVRRAAQEARACPKCETLLVADTSGDLPVVSLADGDVPDGVGAPSIASLPPVEPDEPSGELAEQADVYAAGVETGELADVVDVQSVAASASSDDAAVGDDLTSDPTSGDDPSASSDDGPVRDDVASNPGAEGDAAVAEGAAVEADATAAADPASDGTSTVDLPDDRADHDPAEHDAADGDPERTITVDLADEAVAGGDDGGDPVDAITVDLSDEPDDEDDTLVAEDDLIDLTDASPPAPDRDPLHGWDVDEPRTAVDLPSRGNEAIALVASAITAGIVLGAFSGRRRLLRSVIGALVGVLGALGARRGAEGRDLRRP